MNKDKEVNICFDCKNAVPDDYGRGCPWSIRFEPVPGWTATPVRRSIGGGYTREAYYITACPLFDPDEGVAK